MYIIDWIKKSIRAEVNEDYDIIRLWSSTKKWYTVRIDLSYDWDRTSAYFEMQPWEKNEKQIIDLQKQEAINDFANVLYNKYHS